MADTIEVLDASPDRVQPPCPFVPTCGGCDWQHIAPAAQRRYKGDILREQLQRLAGVDWDGEVVFQSERFDRYEGAITRLTDAGRTYPCFCTRADPSGQQLVAVSRIESLEPQSAFDLPHICGIICERSIGIGRWIKSC